MSNHEVYIRDTTEDEFYLYFNVQDKKIALRFNSEVTGSTISCLSGIENAQQCYPQQFNVLLGSHDPYSWGTGSTSQVDVYFNENRFNYNPYYPSRFIVKYNNDVVIDTGYIGGVDFDYGGTDRISFNNSLSGKTDPITDNTYPDMINYIDDGYPMIITGVTQNSWTDWPYVPSSNLHRIFNKNTAYPDNCDVFIYSPMDNSIWDFYISCPMRFIINEDQTICSGDVSEILTYTLVFTPFLLDGSSGNNIDRIYCLDDFTLQWWNANSSGDPISPITGETSGTYNPGQLFETKYYCLQFSSTCGTIVSQPATITVNTC